MGGQHHGDARQSELMKRFVEQAENKANRAYPNGRVGAPIAGDRL